MAMHREGRLTGNLTKRRTAWWGAMAALVLGLASPGGRAQGTPTFSVDDVSVNEGQSGLTNIEFTITLANPNGMESSVGFTTNDGTALGGLVTVTARSAGAITLGDGPSSPYGEPLTVAGINGPLASLSLLLESLTHPSPGDLDILLVAPSGETMVVQSDAGPATNPNTLSYILRDYNPLIANSLLGGTYGPTSRSPADVFAAPAPSGPYAEGPPEGTATMRDTFAAATVAGEWRAFIVDDSAGFEGRVERLSLTVGVPEPGTDYNDVFGRVVFPPGTTSQRVRVTVNGDTAIEPDETFFLDLGVPVNGTIVDGRGVATVRNDDGGGGPRPPMAVDDRYVALRALPGELPIISRDADRGVLHNDLANGGGPMTVALVQGPATGTLTLRPDGGFTYRATLEQFSVTFSYRVTNANGTSNVATVTLVDQTSNGPYGPTALELNAIYPDGPGRRVIARFEPPAQDPLPEQYALTGGAVPGETLAQIFTGSPNPIFEFTPPASGSYFIRVHGVTGGVISAPSNEVPLNLDTTVAPSAPANLLGAADGSNLTLAWKNTFTGGLPTNSFLRVTGAVSLTLPLGLTETFSYAGVPDGTYTFEVVNGNAGGQSAASDRVTLTFPGACMPPQPPTDFLAYVTGRLFGAIWNLPTNGPAPNGYLLEVVSPIFTGRLPLRTTNIRANVVPGIYDVSVVATTACGLESVPTAVQRVVVQ